MRFIAFEGVLVRLRAFQCALRLAPALVLRLGLALVLVLALALALALAFVQAISEDPSIPYCSF